MEKYLYFRSEVDEDNQGGVGAVSGGGSTLLVPASKLLGMQPTSATNLRLTFESVKNANPSGNFRQVTNDFVDLTVATKTASIVAEAILIKINGGTHNDGFIVVADDTVTLVDGTTKLGEYIHPNITACTVSLQGANNVGVQTAQSNSAGNGAGAVSTGIGKPQYNRSRVGDIIITNVKFDLQGLKAKGGAANDVIGLAAGGAAYIYKNVVADNGVIFKQTLTCLESPTAASGSLTEDINIAWNSSAGLAFDGAAGGTSLLNAGGLAAGGTAEMLVPQIAANHYAYIAEGDTSATDCVFATGIYMLTMYGATIPS
tara:strand:+ start:57 stop:1001 length:945 start_codon:yes stop_codon:yes gene_type:complete